MAQTWSRALIVAAAGTTRTEASEVLTASSGDITMAERVSYNRASAKYVSGSTQLESVTSLGIQLENRRGVPACLDVSPMTVQCRRPLSAKEGFAVAKQKTTGATLQQVRVA